MKKMLTAAAAFAASVILSGPAAFAAAVHVDIRPYVSNNRIETGGFDDENSINYPSLRVYGFDFGETANDPYVIGDPGFNAPGGALPPSTELRFDIPGAAQARLPRSLSYWSGTGPVSFSAVPSAESLQLFRSPTSNLTITGGQTAPLTGLAIENTSSGGGIHRHISSLLNGSDGNTNPTDGTVPADGIYVLPMRLSLTGSSVQPSEIFYLVYNNGESEAAHEQAMEFIEANIVPEPGSAGVVIAAAAGLLARRRHARGVPTTA